LADSLDVSTAKVLMKGRSLQLRPLEARIEESSLRGNATVELPAASDQAKAPVRLVVDLRAERLDVGKLMKPASDAATEKSWFGKLLDRRAETPSAVALPWHVEGKLALESLTIQGVEFSGVTSKGVWDDGQLSLNQFAAELAGGRVAGNLAIRWSERVEPGQSRRPAAGGAIGFDLAAEYTHVDAQQLVEPFPDLSGQYAGQLGGHLRLSGTGDSWEQVENNLAGSGEINGRNVWLANWQLPPAASVRPESAAPRQARFAELTAKFTVGSEGVTLSQAEGVVAGEAGNPARGMRIHASGTIGFDRAVRVVAEERDGRQQAVAEFHWTGSLSSPKLESSASLARNAAGAER
jgi:hypothetical protein